MHITALDLTQYILALPFHTYPKQAQPVLAAPYLIKPCPTIHTQTAPVQIDLISSVWSQSVSIYSIYNTVSKYLTIPGMLPPISRYDSILKSLGNHAPMPVIGSKHMASPA